MPTAPSRSRTARRPCARDRWQAGARRTPPTPKTIGKNAREPCPPRLGRRLPDRRHFLGWRIRGPARVLRPLHLGLRLSKFLRLFRRGAGAATGGSVAAGGAPAAAGGAATEHGLRRRGVVDDDVPPGCAIRTDCERHRHHEREHVVEDETIPTGWPSGVVAPRSRLGRNAAAMSRPTTLRERPSRAA